jgi:chromosome segregation ATPase
MDASHYQSEIDALKTELASVQARLAVSHVDIDQLKVHLNSRKELLEASEKERTVIKANLKEMEIECVALKAKLLDMTLKASVEATANRNTMFDRILRGTIYENTFGKETAARVQPEPKERGVPIVEMFPLFCCNSR